MYLYNQLFYWTYSRLNILTFVNRLVEALPARCPSKPFLSIFSL